MAENFSTSFGSSSSMALRPVFSEGISGTLPSGVTASRVFAAGSPPFELDEDDAGDALQREAGPGVGLDRRFLAQPHVHQHQARIVGIERHRLDRADIDAAEFHRIADREPADRVREMDAVDHVVAVARASQPDGEQSPRQRRSR